MSVQGAINRMWASAAIGAGLTQGIREASRQSKFYNTEGINAYEQGMAGVTSAAQLQDKRIDAGDMASSEYLDDLSKSISQAGKGYEDISRAEAISKDAASKYWGNKKIQQQYKDISGKKQELGQKLGEISESTYKHGQNIYNLRQSHRDEGLDLIAKLASTPGMLDDPQAVAQMKEFLRQSEEIDEDMVASQQPLLELEELYNTYGNQGEQLRIRQEMLKKKFTKDGEFNG